MAAFECRIQLPASFSETPSDLYFSLYFILFSHTDTLFHNFFDFFPFLHARQKAAFQRKAFVRRAAVGGGLIDSELFIQLRVSFQWFQLIRRLRRGFFGAFFRQGVMAKATFPWAHVRAWLNHGQFGCDTSSVKWVLWHPQRTIVSRSWTSIDGSHTNGYWTSNVTVSRLRRSA